MADKELNVKRLFLFLLMLDICSCSIAQNSEESEPSTTEPKRGGIWQIVEPGSPMPFKPTFVIENYLKSGQKYGVIVGLVLDLAKVPIAGLTVQIEAPALIHGVRVTLTNERGEVLFIQLPPGKYKCTFEQSGYYEKLEITDMEVVTGKATFIQPIMEPAGPVVVGPLPNCAGVPDNK